MSRELKRGAIFITDAHYPRHKEELLALFDALLSSPPPQLFLLGDMFEFLCEELPYSVEFNRGLIEKIDAISQKTELYYLEGNHDFLIQDIFSHATVFSIDKQPAVFSFKDKKIALLHGDKYGNASYKIYTSIIRNRTVIKLLRVLTLDINGRFIKSLYPKLLTKKICKSMDSFEQKKAKQLKEYHIDKVNIIIEGHNHTRCTLTQNSFRYEALSAFACNKSFFRVELEDSDICFVEMSLGALRNE